MSEKITSFAPDGEGRIVVFQEQAIRRAWHQSEWWFSVQDVIAILTDSPNPADYIKKMRLRDKELSQGWGQLVTPLRLETEGGIQRDHMTDLELIFTMLGEASTTEIAKRQDAQGFQQNKAAAKEGGAVAGNARKELEAKSGKPVVSRENYLAPSGRGVSETLGLTPPKKKPRKKQ
jgi:hypothetical protein